MKRFFLSLVLIVIVNQLFAGNIEKALFDFDQVEFTGNYKVKMVKADSNYIVVVNDDSKVSDEDIIIKIENKTLKMSLKQDIFVERDINVKLYYVDVNNISARRGVQIKCDQVSAERVVISATTGAKMKIDVKAEHLEVSIKSGGSVRVKGTVASASYNVNAGGTIAAINVEVPIVEASVQFGGEIILKATDTLKAKVKAGGNISYKGKPTVKSKSIKLGGTIEDLDE